MEVTNTRNFAKSVDYNTRAPKQEPTQTETIKAYQDDVKRDAQISKQLSKMEMEKLIAGLNDQMSLISTDLRFGFNSTAEMLEVAVINQKTDEVIRRFPTEEAVTLMASMKEFVGLLFDKRG